jgi:tRNA (guanine-N7-)-methyltransferase
VRRAGRLTTSQQRALEELWPAFGIEFSNEPLQFDILFGRAAPVVLEIGFGNGETLVQQAAEFPEADFLGIEVHEPGVGHCLLKAQDAGVSNLRLIRHDAVEVLDAMIPAGSLSRVNLYFPDPWPKKRHHKRRIVQPRFLETVAKCLSAGGSLHIATDWANYAASMPATNRSTGPAPSSSAAGCGTAIRSGTGGSSVSIISQKVLQVANCDLYIKKQGTF